MCLCPCPHMCHLFAQTKLISACSADGLKLPVLSLPDQPDLGRCSNTLYQRATCLKAVAVACSTGTGVALSSFHSNSTTSTVMLSALMRSSHSYRAASSTRLHAMWGSGDSTTMSHTCSNTDSHSRQVLSTSRACHERTQSPHFQIYWKMRPHNVC